MEENENLAFEIDALLLSRLDKKTPYKRLVKILYFIPDSLLKKYLHSPKSLSEIDKNYLAQFFSSNVSYSNYFLYRQKEESDGFIGAGDQSKLKIYSQYNSKQVFLQYIQEKASYEKYFEHNYVFGHYRYKKNKVFGGHLKVSGINPLIFSSPYGTYFYGFNSIRRKPSYKVSGQTSLNKQNTFLGAGISHESERLLLHFSVGKQNYDVSLKNKQFGSFNFYKPVTYIKSNYENVNEHIVLTDFKLNLNENLTFEISHLSTFLSEKYQIKTSATPLVLEKANYVGSIINYKSNNFHLSYNYSTYLKQASAYEIFSSYIYEKNIIEFSSYKYDASYLNTHSTKFLLGSSFARNLRGTVTNVILMPSKRFHFYFNHHERRELESAKQDVVDTDYSSGIKWFFDRDYVYFQYKKRSSDQYQLFYIDNDLRYKCTAYPHLNSFYLSVEESKQNYLLKVAYINAENGIRVYKNGMYREYLTDYFLGENLSLSLIYKYSMFKNAIFSFGYYATYRFDKSEFGSGSNKLNQSMKNELSISFRITY